MYSLAITFTVFNPSANSLQWKGHRMVSMLLVALPLGTFSSYHFIYMNIDLWNQMRNNPVSQNKRRRDRGLHRVEIVSYYIAFTANSSFCYDLGNKPDTDEHFLLVCCDFLDNVGTFVTWQFTVRQSRDRSCLCSRNTSEWRLRVPNAVTAVIIFSGRTKSWRTERAMFVFFCAAAADGVPSGLWTDV